MNTTTPPAPTKAPRSIESVFNELYQAADSTANKRLTARQNADWLTGCVEVAKTRLPEIRTALKQHEQFMAAVNALAELRDAVTTSTVAGGTVVAAMTPQAVQEQRNQEVKLAAATTEAEKKTVREEMKLYRVHLTYSGVEGEIVQKALGQTPAVELMKLCRAKLGLPETESPVPPANPPAA